MGVALWLLDRWYIAVLVYGVAFLVYVGYLVRSIVKSERDKLARSDVRTDDGSDFGAYRDDFDNVADDGAHFYVHRSGFDNFPVRCVPGSGSVQCDLHRIDSGRLVPVGAAVLEHEKALT